MRNLVSTPVSKRKKCMDNKPVTEKLPEKPKIVQVKNLTILEVGLFKGSHYFLQRMGNIFQYIIFRNGEFFQAYISVLPRKGQDDFTQQDLIETARVIKNFMETTTEALIKKEEMIKKELGKKSVKKKN